MEAILTTLLTIIVDDLLPNITTSATVQKIIDMLIKLIPLLVSEYQALVVPVKNIIASLSVNAATTQDQITTLQTLDAQVDADFEAAATAAQAEDAAT